MRKKVLIAAGGSGGHLFPAMQLQKRLPDCEVVFAGHHLEKTPYFDRSLPFFEIASSSKKTGFLSFFKGIFQSIRLLRKFKPDIVVGFGSFHTFPILLASLFLFKKMVLFEANATLGKVNRLFAPFAKKIAVQFPSHQKRSVLVPLLPWTTHKKYAKAEARKEYGLDPNVFTILVFGGSQGALFINETFAKAANFLQFPFQILHFVGKGKKIMSYNVRSIVKEFEENMAMAYAAADMVISRCGAGTCAELLRNRLPAILIPYPYAYNHQVKNGEVLKGACQILSQRNMTSEILADTIIDLKTHLALHQKAFDDLRFPKTTDFAKVILGEIR